MSKLSRAAKRLARMATPGARAAAAPATAAASVRNNAPPPVPVSPTPTLPTSVPSRTSVVRPPARPTGPRTPEGKAVSSQNARKHGLTSSAIHVPEDLREEYDTMSSSLQNELQPQGALEKTIFEHLLRAAWNIYRIGIFEDQILTCRENLTCEEVAAAVDQFRRYRASDERTFYKALKQLQDLQTNRALRDTLTAELPTHTPLLTKISAITKRTPTPTRGAEPRSGFSAPASHQDYKTNSSSPKHQRPSDSGTAHSSLSQTTPEPATPANYRTNSPATPDRLRSEPSAQSGAARSTPAPTPRANCETNSPSPQNRFRSESGAAHSGPSEPTSSPDWSRD